ncbi:MAG: type I DNA topoisomerase, partial [Bacteroidota bacterium]
MKCKTKREIKDPVASFNAKGSPVTTGVCPVCGTKLFRMGRTEAHEGVAAPEKKAKPRHGKLVIVESPAKARTVGRFLGRGYTVRASIGHVRDLLRSQLSVDIENNFEPKYRVPNEKKEVVKEIKHLAKGAEEIYLATDPDREGESISWHLMEAAELEPERTRRVVFHEITEPAIHEAFSHPRDIDMHLVNAQQARRVLDRLVGYSISPILWEKVRSRLSAGRVQSVALRLIVEREREIESFVPVEYWTIGAEFKPEGVKQSFIATLVRVDEQEPAFPDEASVKPVVSDMETGAYVITKIKRGERRRRPSAPFTTSTLQQEASRRLGFTAKRTMGLAQALYEGQDVGEGGTSGLITYMRTDSTNVSTLAQSEARSYIRGKYGADFLPAEAPVFKTRSAGAQEAHEAIRPTSVMREPEKVKKYLEPAMFKLYNLIWQRFV